MYTFLIDSMIPFNYPTSIKRTDIKSILIVTNVCTNIPPTNLIAKKAIMAIVTALKVKCSCIMSNWTD